MTLAGTGDVVAITAELDEVTRENQTLRHLVNQHADALRRANIDAFNAHAEVAALQDKLDAVADICDQAEQRHPLAPVGGYVVALRMAIR